MKRNRHILLFIVLSLLPMAVAAKGVPTWLERVHDFGAFAEQTDTVQCTMRVVNTGDSAMMITRVVSSCGCTVARYSHEVMQPGDTGTVTITYSARRIPGQFEKKVLVYTNGSPRKTELTVKGTVIGSPETVSDRYPVAVGPVRLNAAMLPMGQITRGGGRDAYLSGYNTSTTDTMRVSVADVPMHMSAHVLPAEVAPGGLFIISVYYESGAAPLWGLNEDTISIEAEPLHPTERSLAGASHVVVTAQVAEDFSRMTDAQRRKAPAATLNTSKVDFGDGIVAVPDTVVRRTVRLMNTGKSALELRQLFVPHGEGITAACSAQRVKPGKTAVITLELTPADRSDAVIDTRLTVMTNDPSSPQQTVRLVGIIQEAHSIHPRPTQEIM